MKWILILLTVVAAICTAKQRDPTQEPPMTGTHPAATSAQLESKTLAVSAIITSGKRNVAIINGHALSVGDKFEQFEVLTITPKTVTVKDNQGSEIELHFLLPVVFNQ